MERVKKRIFHYKNEYVKSVKLVHHDVATNRRYRLDIELKNGDNEKAVHLMMINPSKANEEISDNTLNRIIKYVSLNNVAGVLQDIGKIIITNLYVVCETYPEKVDEYITVQSLDFVKGIDRNGKYNNDSIIEMANKEAQLIIIAWGKGYIFDYDKRIQEIFSLMKNKEIYQMEDLTQEGYPRHPRTWAYSWKLKRYSI
ncbi:DUF1643 domain-containing protein [Lysinibacillus sp. CD3-6]|uniref:DUF1643 domain-containing protein n=1 Tax=Lysinibacillus sp. CD3-6 TaxID=2892541 RepID=UPI0011210F10|nr:DUF1643 domain-containing protein [Lysinibacillus sp. CD3-6]UED79595.1 DUF1643 domain-containing protein [Lysinibacillus sp. CD3-6]